MKQERLNLYRIDMKYIRNLHNIDNRVSSVSPQIGKQHRIYVGLVVVKANCLYRLCVKESNYKGKDRCLDFKGLEIECDKYLSIINISEPTRK